MGVKQNQKSTIATIAHDQADFVWMRRVLLAMRIQQPYDSGKKAWKRARRYTAERSIMCTVIAFIEAITGH
jgi:hypothetical protein